MTAPRTPEAWETNQPGAAVTVGRVGVFALDGDRFAVRAPDEPQQIIEGFDEARALAHALAGRGGEA